MTVQVVENFVTKEYCNTIICNLDGLMREAPRPKYFESNNQYLPIPFSLQNFSSPEFDFLDTEKKILAASFICNTLHLAQKEIEKFYGVTLDECQGGVVKMLQGAKNRLHSDMYQLDGSQWDDGSGREDEYEYSALLYLSTKDVDFSGGNIFFPQHKLLINPECGNLVFFRGDLDHVHEVSEITSGERFALIMFFGK